MIRIKLKEVLARKEFEGGKRITFEQISKTTGIHRTTLSKIANSRNYNTTVENLDKLCAYFEIPLDELAEYIPD